MSVRRGTPAWLLIAAAEARLLRRSPFAVVMAAVLPTATGLLIVWAEADTSTAGWGAAAGLLLLTLATFTAYAAGTTTLAARRQQSVLKRLRLSGASDLAVIAGTLVPVALLTIVQTLVLFAVIVVADGLPPIRPILLLITAGAATLAACVLAVATATFTASPELAQITTAPIALALVGGGFWAASTPVTDVTWQMLALPGGAVVELTRIGWHEPGATRAAGAFLALTAFVVLVTPAAMKAFGWDPRR